jgi:hypothetical protein
LSGTGLVGLETVAQKLKLLIIEDLSISCIAIMLRYIADAAGYSEHFIDARLQYDDAAHTSYRPDLAQHILSVSLEFKPDWVVMVLQGRYSSHAVQVAIRIHERLPNAKFFFISGYPHTEELNHARSCGLNFSFAAMPFALPEFLDVIKRG